MYIYIYEAFAVVVCSQCKLLVLLKGFSTYQFACTLSCAV